MSDRMNKKIIAIFFAIFIYPAVFVSYLFAFEQTVTIPAERPQGITLDLKKGDYIARIEGGAIALFYPINPNYRWLVSVSIGTDAEGGQDRPDIGTLYFEPDPAARTQAYAEDQAVRACKENMPGTFLKFSLTEDRKVRFWVSDFDYTDNSGMVKVTVSSV